MMPPIALSKEGTKKEVPKKQNLLYFLFSIGHQ